MIRRLLLLAALLCAPLCAPGLAHAQQATTVSTCGALTYTAGFQRPLQQDTTGNLCTVASATITGGTVGNVASGATDSGNPVKVGSVYNSSVPTFTTGQRADLQSNQHGSLYVQLTDNFTQPVAATVLNVDANIQTAIALNVASFRYGYNGSTWDRERVASVAQGSTTSGQYGPLAQGAVITAPPTYVTAQTSPLSIQPIGGGLRIVPSVPDATVTGSPPPSLMMGGWLASSGASQAVRMGATGSLQVSQSSPYPYSTGSVAAVPLTGASGNVANASAAATLAAAASVTDYITGFQCTAAGATAAAVVNVTVTGVITGTMTYTFVFPAGATLQATPLVVAFPVPVPASATNTAIVVTLPAGGAGNTNAACNAQGFRY